MGHYAGLHVPGPRGARREGACRSTPRRAWPRSCARTALEPAGRAGATSSCGEVEPGSEVRLSPGIAVTPFLVPHRDEFSDTVGFRVRGPARALLYIPDIDKWERWDRRWTTRWPAWTWPCSTARSPTPPRCPGRARPTSRTRSSAETLAAVPAALRSRVRFIHLNHTNRLLWDAGCRRASRPRAPRARATRSRCDHEPARPAEAAAARRTRR